MAAEYIVSSGNPNVILCERGIRTFETYTRNTMDLAAVPLLHHLTHLPVIVDPSHATGKRWLVKPLAIGGVAVGADGVMVEVHPTPGPGAVRRRAAAHPRPVPRPDGGRSCPVHAHVRGLHGDPVEAGAAARRSAPAGGLAEALIATDVATVRPGRAPARRAAAARRQVDQPPGAAARDAGGRARAGSPGPATAPTSARPPAIMRALGRATVGARPSERRTGGTSTTASSSPGADGLHAARRRRSTAATPARVCDSSPGCSPGCR